MFDTPWFLEVAKSFAMHKLGNMKTKLVSAVEAANELGFDRATITRMANAGQIKGQKLGSGRTSAWVFTPAAIREAKKRLDKGRAA